MTRHEKIAKRQNELINDNNKSSTGLWSALALLALILITIGYLGKQDRQTSLLEHQAYVSDCKDRTLTHDVRAYACNQIER